MATSVTSLATGHWAAINEASFVLGMRLLFWISRVCGRWPFRIVLQPVLAWYVLARPAARRASADYLKRVGQFVPVRQGSGGVVRHFGAFAEVILDKMLLWGGLFDTCSVRFYGREPMLELIAARRGALLVCSHMGNTDLSRLLANDCAGLRMTVLVHTQHAQAFNKMLAKLNPQCEMHLLQVTELNPATAMLLAERVADGQFVVIAGDRIPVSAQPRVVYADFMGSKAAFPIGPYVLASLLRCPIYTLFSHSGGDGVPEVHFELLREAVRLPRSGREAVLEQLAGEFALRLQFHCIRAPLEWFNFYDFWAKHVEGNNAR